ncbi:MAG: hypothetical protein DCC75_09000 [Proteobacteria bacterium]|nr:MAG: hypothetical protein DCC75_09000 [Pseudomonadota bacterium]
MHVVNNIAQVIAIESDSLANELESKPIPPDDDARKKMAAQVEQIENLARYLSLEVTDLKLNKELLRIKAFSKGEVVDLNTVAAELRRFADFQSQRRGAQISCSNELGRLAAIEGVNIDLLQTVLRGLLRDAVSTPGDERPQSAVSFKIVGTQVVIEITGNGKVLEWEEFRGQVTEKMIRHRDDPKYMNILGAAHLCELGQGTFEIQPQQGERSVAFKLVFERAMPNSRAAADLSSWALFVDDNPQVTNFYAKVATALDLKYHTAGSLNEAKNLIQSDGKPMLVITDVELGDGNGSELVKDIRERFGPGVPVIVVSGHTEESTRDKINEAGGVKFLSKPVGRAQLFSEIKSLLGKA